MASTVVYRERGFGLIELLVLIVLVGVVASVALQSMTRVTRDVRKVTTEREMEMLAEAIVGNPELTQAGIRSDFGYVGDIGAFPPNLEALVTNPGGWSTWNGPYTQPGFTPVLSQITTDAWGAAYQYAGGAVIVSTGGGSSLTHRLADSTSDYLYNRLIVTIADINDNPPGAIMQDSVHINIRIPNGMGGLTTRAVHPDSTGLAVLDSLPVGCHRLEIIFAPDADTLGRYVTILPRNKNTGELFKFGTAVFSGASLTPGIAGEIGMMNDDQANGSEWHQMTFVNSYSDPVVVMRGMSHSGLAPAHLRVKGVTPLGFSWQIEEWDYLGGNHVTEQCPYIVVEAGTHILEDGTKIVAGNESCTDAWTSVTFPSGFTSMPVLLTGVASADDPAACVTRTRNLSTNGFDIRLQEEEAADDVHGAEIVSWIAVEPGAGVNNGVAFIANQTPNAVRHTLYQITFSPSFSSAPIFLCHDDTYDNNDPCATRFAFLGGSSVYVRIEEEMSHDIDFWHTTERVSWLAWGEAANIITLSGL